MKLSLTFRLSTISTDLFRYAPYTHYMIEKSQSDIALDRLYELKATSGIYERTLATTMLRHTLTLIISIVEHIGFRDHERFLHINISSSTAY